MKSGPVTLEGVHCTITIDRPSTNVVLVTFIGRDVGELGDAPFQELAKDVEPGRRIELFIDARQGRAATADVSGDWAKWLGKNRASFRHVSMLTGSRFIQISAEFVRKFADLGETMRLYSDPAAFEGALASAAANEA